MESVEEKELKEKIRSALRQEGFKGGNPGESDNYFTMEVKYKNEKDSYSVRLDSIYYGSRTGFRSDGKFKGVIISSGYGKNRITTKIMQSNSSNSVIKTRVKEFKEKYTAMVKRIIERTVKNRKEAEDSKSLKSLVTNSRFYFDIEASRYNDEYTMKIRNLRVKEIKQIIGLLNKMDKK